MNAADFTDPVAEQLFDEIMSRVWAIGELAPLTNLADIPTPLRGAIAEGAASTARDLRRCPRADVVYRLQTLLWSGGAQPVATDPWWRTPLGELLAGSLRQADDREGDLAPPPTSPARPRHVRPPSRSSNQLA